MTNSTASPRCPRLSSRAGWLLVLSLFLSAGCETCSGCGAEQKDEEPDLGTIDTFEPDPGEDPLAGAAEEAKKKAVSVAVGRSDEARFLAGDIAADREEESSPSPTPNTVPAEPEGKIAADELQKVFRENSAAYRECYERQLKKNPSLQGRVILNLTIASDGSVARADVQGDTLLDEHVNSCIEDRVRNWSFPEPSGGAAKVRKPFTFSPEKN